jgi:deazaflavin-dependent oxidoreductase (nitroreductase family)
MPKTKPLSRFEQAAVQRFGQYVGGAQTWLYRATGGRLAGSFRGAPVLLLTTIGRKSGQERTCPLLYLRDGDDYVIVASKGGFPSHPAWFLNLQANPAVTIQAGADTVSVQARVLSGDEKSRVWPRLVQLYADYQSYQDRTDRDIPVVALRPR